jgi:hypothetical protein
MDDEIRIRFRGICTHLVNDTPHTVGPGGGPPRDLDLRPVHIRRPHPPLRHRVFIPWYDGLPERVKELVPRHYPRLRYRQGDVSPIEGWEPVLAPDHFWEVDLTHVAIWFDGVVEADGDHPAEALAELPSVWTNTPEDRQPRPDHHAFNNFDRTRAAAYVDFFDGQKLLRLDDPINEVIATLRISDTPTLVWKPFDGPTSSANIRPGAEIQITNMAEPCQPCEERDYLLHYLATKLNLNEGELPRWKEEPEPVTGPNRPYCSNSTYP